jgi:hypothetical protein
MTQTSDTEQTLRVWILSGFYGLTELREMLAEILQPEDDEQALLALLERELSAKDAAEADWPPEVVGDRLDRLFEGLWRAGIIALQNAGHSMSDGLDDVAEALAPYATGKFKGYCFYHGQDVARALHEGRLLLAFGNLQNTPDGKLWVGKLVRQAFENAGFTCEWNEDPDTRIALTGIQWQRRRPR